MVAAGVEVVVVAAVAVAAALAAALELAQALAAMVVFAPVVVVEDQLRNAEDSGGEIVSALVQGLLGVQQLEKVDSAMRDDSGVAQGQQHRELLYASHQGNPVQSNLWKGLAVVRLWLQLPLKINWHMMEAVPPYSFFGSRAPGQRHVCHEHFQEYGQQGGGGGACSFTISTWWTSRRRH